MLESSRFAAALALVLLAMLAGGCRPDAAEPPERHEAVRAERASDLTAATTAAAVLGGRLLDSTGSALPAADVVLQGIGSAIGGERHHTRTDATGSFRFKGLWPGRYSLAFGATGHQVLRQVVQLAVESRILRPIRLVAGRSPDATASAAAPSPSPDGPGIPAPAAGALREVGELGVLAGPVPPIPAGGEHSTGAAAAMALPAAVSGLPVLDPAEQSEAPRSRPIEGRVTDQRGLPLANARISATAPGLRVQTLSDAAGRFQVLAPEEHVLQLSVQKGGYAAHRQRLAAGTQHVPPLQLVRLAQVVVRVQDALTGAPLRRFSVRVGAQRSQPAYDPHGEHVLDVAPGRHRLQVSAPGYATAVLGVRSAADGPDPLPLVVTLTRAGALHGTLLEATGAPAHGASIAVGRARVRTDHRGGFRLRGIPEGQHDLDAVTVDGRRLVVRAVGIRGGETTGPLRLHLEP